MGIGSSTAAGILRRALFVFLAGSCIYIFLPGLWISLVAPVAGWLASSTCFYLDAVHVSVNGLLIDVSGELTLGAILLDGSVIPSLPGKWNKEASPTVLVLVVGLAVFFAPAASLRRRACLFPVMLALVVLIAAVDLAVDIQYTAARGLLGDALSTFAFRADEVNVAINERLVSRRDHLALVVEVAEGGGRLFLGGLAGLLPYLIRLRCETGQFLMKVV